MMKLMFEHFELKQKSSCIVKGGLSYLTAEDRLSLLGARQRSAFTSLSRCKRTYKRLINVYVLNLSKRLLVFWAVRCKRCL
jgi:hypothetical protein